MKPLSAPLVAWLDRLRIQPRVTDRLLYWVYGPEFRRWCRSNTCDFLVDRSELYRFLINREGLDGPIDYLEFGVSRGDSIRWWVENNRHPESKLVGFDSFEGLPEPWAIWPKGAFSTEGRAPEIADWRCSFVKGLFQDTVPAWLAGREFSRRVVAHLDADLYSSTLLVLTQLLPKLKKDDILIFDQFQSYLHEFRAFFDSTRAYQRAFVPIGRTADWVQVSLKST
jgi:O-methyltransferase